ncbi:MAG: DUF4253 domain-containing protein [Burkholderiales bacterium]|nr:MAG: DUF4253 domain-containing protein [Burkholderiales bacterium]
MGAWSHDAFGNDTACDWAQGLDEVSDLSLVEAAIGAALDADDDGLDADVACEALAAIEVLARLRGNAGYSNAYTERVDDWVARTRLVPPDGLLQQALTALEAIASPASELRELWDEGEAGPQWQASLAELRARLQAPPQPLPAPLDEIGLAVREVTSLSFAVPDDPSPGMAVGPLVGVARQRLYFVALAAEAVGDWARLRDAVCRLWPLLDPDADLKLQWDLAVRDAKSWAAEGHLEAALAGLAPWRESAETLGLGTFDMRCMAVAQEAGAVAEGERLRDGLIAAGHGATMQILDRALREARAGDAGQAQALLTQHAADFSAPGWQVWVRFARGILAVRAGDGGGLALLTAWVAQQAPRCRDGAAVWTFFGIGAGWWALALQQGGRTDEARRVLATVRPLLRGDENTLLRGSLRAAGLLDEAPLSPPTAATPPEQQAGLEAHHGSFRTVTVRGVNALQHLLALRRAFAEGRGAYPFLIGDDDDLASLLDNLETPADGGVALAAEARALDAAAWLSGKVGGKRPRWSARGAAPVRSLQTLLDTRGQRLKPCVHIGLIELEEPWSLFTRLGFGDWNACPTPAEHGALHRHWGEHFGAEPAALGADTVECLVARPPRDKAPALALAAEHQAYCPDIVEQGVGTTAALAASLLAAPVWYFWWD